MSGEEDRVRWRGVRPVHGIRGIWPDRDAVRIDESAVQAADGTVKIYTVPTGKKLFIASAFLGSRLSNTEPAWSSLKLYDSGDTELYIIYVQLMDVAGQLATSQAFFPALEADAGDYIQLEVPDVPLDARGIIHGWLEDA